MITKIEKDTPIEPGQYVCFDSIMLGGICTRPRRVTKVAGQRLYVMDTHEEKESFKSRTTAVFLCSTKDEGEALTKISVKFVQARRSRIDTVEDEIATERGGEIDRLIAASNGGAA